MQLQGDRCEVTLVEGPDLPPGANVALPVLLLLTVLVWCHPGLPLQCLRTQPGRLLQLRPQPVPCLAALHHKHQCLQCGRPPANMGKPVAEQLQLQVRGGCRGGRLVSAQAAAPLAEATVQVMVVVWSALL